MKVLFMQLALKNLKDRLCRELVVPLERDSWLSSCTQLSCVATWSRIYPACKMLRLKNLSSPETLLPKPLVPHSYLNIFLYLSAFCFPSTIQISCELPILLEVGSGDCEPSSELGS